SCQRVHSVSPAALCRYKSGGPCPPVVSCVFLPRTSTKVVRLATVIVVPPAEPTGGAVGASLLRQTSPCFYALTRPATSPAGTGPADCPRPDAEHFPPADRAPSPGCRQRRRRRTQSVAAFPRCPGICLALRGCEPSSARWCSPVGKWSAP